jgi:predicted regulator of amino acid metabolism with ACT domain
VRKWDTGKGIFQSVVANTNKVQKLAQAAETVAKSQQFASDIEILATDMSATFDIKKKLYGETVLKNGTPDLRIDGELYAYSETELTYKKVITELAKNAENGIMNIATETDYEKISADIQAYFEKSKLNKLIVLHGENVYKLEK